ncbi:MAG: phage head morphogenesis protein [Alistipes sp.]|nr:phage head morphogenesis protein [Alistipes sp.]
MCIHCKSLIEAIDGFIAKADDDLKDDLEESGRVSPDETVDCINEIEDGVTAALLSETDYFIKQIKKRKTLTELLDDLEEIKAKDIYCDEIKTVVSGQLHKLVPKLVKEYVSIVDKEIEITTVSKRTTAWIDNWSGQLSELMKLDSHKQIEDILKKGFENGSDIASVTRDILDSGMRDEHYRARRVAVTEVLGAHNAAKQEAAMQNPCIKEKMWRHTGAYNNSPRENHVDMDGQKVLVSEPYSLTGAGGETYHPMFPTDPILPPGERINCHCLSQDIVDEDILGLSPEERQRLQQEAIDSMDDEWEKELDAQNRAKAGIEED